MEAGYQLVELTLGFSGVSARSRETGGVGTKQPITDVWQRRGEKMIAAYTKHEITINSSKQTAPGTE